MVYSFGFVIWFLDIWIYLRYFEKCNRLGEFMGLKYVFLDLRLFHTNRRQPNRGKQMEASFFPEAVCTKRKAKSLISTAFKS